MSKAFVFIDGSNFYHKLKDLAYTAGGVISLLDFDYIGFCKSLILFNELIEIRYYVGALKRRKSIKSEKIYADQQRLIAKLQQQNITIVLGQLIQHPDKSFHEKGVDVRLAVEMIRLARRNSYDVAYLLSSDTDLAPAIEEVQLLGKTVVYVGAVKGQSYKLTSVSNRTQLFCAKDIQIFLPKLNSDQYAITARKVCVHACQLI
jgi:uncharacterized LabA/DUF88 family protein